MEMGISCFRGIYLIRRDWPTTIRNGEGIEWDKFGKYFIKLKLEICIFSYFFKKIAKSPKFEKLLLNIRTMQVLSPLLRVCNIEVQRSKSE